ncbi:MAG: acyl dehydratase [Dehalococcoidia bacterium]|jgi:acyl dehydratase|nr:MAG: acyl dehydratase [Dehalococcoidia bacterium]
MSTPVEFKEGASLPTLKKNISQDNINLYAKASGDFNPIHIDADYARKTPLGGTVAHGMLILACVSQMMTNAFGRDWLSGGRLNVRFRAPARPGDVITVSGTIRRMEKGDGFQMIDCDILCRNQNNEPIITGDAKVKVGDK